MLFREKLIELRQAAGLTQEAVADASGVPLSSLRKYEQGARVHVPLGIAVRLARALGVDCGAFAECSDVAGQAAPPAAGVKPAAAQGEVKPAAKGKRKRK